MKRISEDIFIRRFPTLDLHGYDRDSARVALNIFVEENYRLNNKDLVIVHGIGQGIIRTEVHDNLKKNIYVMEFKLHNYNLGCTIVKLK